MTMLLNCELVSRVKLCLVNVFPEIVKDCPRIRNLPKIFLISFENVVPGHEADTWPRALRPEVHQCLHQCPV